MDEQQQCNDKPERPETASEWWQFRTRLERKLLIIVIAMSLTLFAIMTYAFFTHITSKYIHLTEKNNCVNCILHLMVLSSLS